MAGRFGGAYESDPAEMTLADWQALERAPKRRARVDLADVAGKVWASPNTALGAVLGAAGYAAGQLNRLRPGEQGAPRVQVGHNAVEFINNPVSPVGALTLGNTTIYGTDPYDPKDEHWGNYPQEYGHTIQEHEKQHTRQSQQLGPFYLPSNIAGGLAGLIRDGEWHAPSNWNERGPSMRNPQPWPARRR